MIQPEAVGFESSPRLINRLGNDVSSLCKTAELRDRVSLVTLRSQARYKLFGIRSRPNT